MKSSKQVESNKHHRSFTKTLIGIILKAVKIVLKIIVKIILILKCCAANINCFGMNVSRNKPHTPWGEQKSLSNFCLQKVTKKQLFFWYHFSKQSRTSKQINIHTYYFCFIRKNNNASMDSIYTSRTRVLFEF